ncbi:MAG: hypothetical protein FJ125_05865, partial [Deltaproteobacteria bacterium]|nr:hypothetical protein [Deltaproteobacteria bacterium]
MPARWLNRPARPAGAADGRAQWRGSAGTVPAALCLVLGACAAGSAGPERRTTQPVAESNGQQPMTTTASASEDAPPAVALAPALEAPPGLFPVSQTGGLGAMGGGAVPGAPAGPTCPGPPARSTTFPFFEAGEAEGSVSVGTVTDGYLVNAATLPEPCPHCHVLPRQAARCLTHGSDELIGLLLRSAARLAREWPGTVLHLGNLSAAHGGDITWSMSHNSGRDADIAFPMTDPEGIPVEPPDMLYFDAHGWSFDLHGAYRIDLERTWAVIRTLLQDEQTTVQFVFIYRPLGQALLAHAHRKREPAKLIERAAEVMMQPGISLHNDHFHVRIHCSAQDVRLGCQELGPRREGAPDPLPLVRERIRQLQPLLASADAGQRYRAAHLLGVLGEPSAASAVIRLLRDGEPAVRWRSLRTLVELQTSTAVGAVVELLRGEQDPALLLAALEALERLGGPHAERGLIRLVTDPRELPLAEIADYSVGPGQRLAAAEEAADQPSPGGGGSVAAGAGGDVVARTGEEQESEVQL